jgi:hypothetical protein
MMLPPMIPIRQQLPGEALTDVAGVMRSTLQALNLGRCILPGMTVGIPVGSRGIQNLAMLVQEMVRQVRVLGASPLVVAAMGSHGGATSEGQVEVLRSLGVTEETVGAPVVGNVEAVAVGRTSDSRPVYFCRVLLGCDALLVLNRVKPHTSFHGPLESGLVKMLVVGCGKPAGARAFHAFGPEELPARLREMGDLLLSKVPVAGGVAVIENGREEIADLVPVHSTEFPAAEERLLKRAKALLPRLPVTRLDLLVVDRMGKDISGTGMDTNVIGRVGIRGVPDGEPAIQRVVALDLSDGSHGNANGMGLADFVTLRFLDKVDFGVTYMNTLTATFVERAKLPIVLESDQAAVETALRSLGDRPAPRIIRIGSTLELENLRVSPAILDEVAGRPGIEVTGGPESWPFDEQGWLRD